MPRARFSDLDHHTTFRVVTVSEHLVRVLYGDRDLVAEQVDERWPLVRDEDQSVASWTRAVVHALRAEQRRHRVPTVVAGPDRAVHRAVGIAQLATAGVVDGRHDWTDGTELHRVAWPMVRDQFHHHHVSSGPMPEFAVARH